VVDVEAGLVEDSTRLSELASWQPTGNTVSHKLWKTLLCTV